MSVVTAPVWAVTGVAGDVVSVSGTLISRGEDAVQIVCAGPEAAAVAAGTAVTVGCGTWGWAGEVKTSKAAGSGASKTVVHQCRGGYFRLSQHTYTQKRKFWRTTETTPEIYEADSAFVTLMQGTEGENITADDQITEACTQAGITVAECSTGLVLPMWDERGITLKGIIEKVVTLAPKCAVWFDADGALHIAPGPVVSLSALLSYNIGQRADLGVRGVIVEIQRLDEFTISGETKQYLTQEIQSAGATSGVGICYIPLQASGVRSVFNASSSAQTVDVVVDAIPADLTAGKAFWIDHVQDLAEILEADLTIEAAAVDPATTLGNLAVSAIPDAIGRDTQEVKFSATVSYKVRDAAGNVCKHVKAAKVTFTGLATDADTATYITSAESSYDLAAEDAEQLPDGIAASLYAAWNETFAEGDLSFHARLLSSVQVGGKITALGVTGYIQSIQFDSSSNTCTARVAPPDQSGLQSMVKLQAGMKSLSGGASSMAMRASGDPADGARQLLEGGSKVPDENSGTTPGVESIDIQHDGSTSAPVKVVRDIADITDTPLELRYRKKTLRTYVEGAAKKTEIWGLFSPGDDTEDTAATETIPGDALEEDITIYCKEFMLTAKLRYKTVGEVTTYYGITGWSKVPYESTDAKLLLQVKTGTPPTLELDKGFFKA